jgi:hypothetical protein
MRVNWAGSVAGYSKYISASRGNHERQELWKAQTPPDGAWTLKRKVDAVVGDSAAAERLLTHAKVSTTLLDLYALGPLPAATCATHRHEHPHEVHDVEPTHSSYLPILSFSSRCARTSSILLSPC